MNRTIKSIAELEQFAREFLNQLAPNDTCSTVVGLSGDLGSGKTAFVKSAAKALGITEEVLSPTFVIAKFYDIPGRREWSRLAHIDLYRIEDAEELQALRWESIANDPRNLVFVEWPENIGGAFPKHAPILTFRFVDDTTRMVSLKAF